MESVFIKKRWLYKTFVFLFVFLQLAQITLFQIPKLSPAPVESLTSSTDTLSNSRLSYYAKISGPILSGSTYFTIQSSGAPDTDVQHLFPQDPIAIGVNGGLTVATTSGTLNFTTTTALTATVANNDPVYATQSATHTITFTTANTVSGNGIIRAYIPAGDSTSASNDGKPDGAATAGFDLNTLNGNETGNVTCSGGGVSWGAYAATPSATVLNNTHTVQCAFYGTLASGQAITMTIGGSTKKMINPAPKTGHTRGSADTYAVKIQELQYPNYNLVDSVNMSVSPVEAVLVQATINPSLTFTITGQAVGQTRCGRTTSVTTTATTVPFGELTGSDTFYDAAHLLTVSTNATNGYTIQVLEDGNLQKVGTSTNIADTTCDSGSACTAIAKGQWQTAAANYGWGYSLQPLSMGSSTMAFNYNDTSGGNCTGGTTYCAKAFACTAVSGITTCGTTTAAQTLASSTVPVSSQTFYSCYRLNYGPTQNTGYYQTRLLYYPLATF